MPSPYDPKADIGVNRVRAFFLEELAWIFREQPIADIGIDAVVEVVEDGLPPGKLIALQIKTGYKNRWRTQDESYRWPDTPEKFGYWSAFSVPVLMVFVDIDENWIHWEVVRPDKLVFDSHDMWSLVIKRKLTTDAKEELLKVALERDSLFDTMQRLMGLFQCPHCGADMDVRTYQATDPYQGGGDFLVEDFVCGHIRLDSVTKRPCPEDPEAEQYDMDEARRAEELVEHICTRG